MRRLVTGPYYNGHEVIEVDLESEAIMPKSPPGSLHMLSERRTLEFL